MADLSSITVQAGGSGRLLVRCVDCDHGVRLDPHDALTVSALLRIANDHQWVHRPDVASDRATVPAPTGHGDGHLKRKALR